MPIASWPAHITYPQMAYDAPLHQYLLTFTHSYGTQPPAIWRGGSELDILVAPHPWGPFSFVARETDFGPSNGYGAGFPLSWISPNGRRLWLKWAANFDGCAPSWTARGATDSTIVRCSSTWPANRPPTTAHTQGKQNARAMFARDSHNWRQWRVTPTALLRQASLS